MASCQYPVSPATIKGRADILGKTYDWYQQIDAAYYAIYQKVKDTITDGLVPYTKVKSDLTAAYGLVNLGGLAEKTATNFTNNYASIKQNIDSIQVNSAQYALMSFGSSQLSDLTYPASSFKQLVNSPMSTLFSYLTMRMTPASETCITSILSKVVPTLDPYAKSYVDLSTQAINGMPNFFASASSSIQKSIDGIKALTGRINICAGAGASANACVDQIVSKF